MLGSPPLIGFYDHPTFLLTPLRSDFIRLPASRRSGRRKVQLGTRFRWNRDRNKPGLPDGDRRYGVSPRAAAIRRTRPVIHDRQLDGNACTVMLIYSFSIFIFCLAVLMSHYLLFVSGCAALGENVPVRGTIK